MPIHKNFISRKLKFLYLTLIVFMVYTLHENKWNEQKKKI